MMRSKKYIINKKQLVNGILLSVLLYFVFHAIYGNRGILAYFNLNQKIEKAEKELEEIRAERLELKHKVKLLKSDSLDPDMLDEQVRKNLGVAGNKEKAFVPASP